MVTFEIQKTSRKTDQTKILRKGIDDQVIEKDQRKGSKVAYVEEKKVDP